MGKLFQTGTFASIGGKGGTPASDSEGMKSFEGEEGEFREMTTSSM